MAEHEGRSVRVALAGQPNVGKSTVFNLLTGLNQRVGNWPGKTVEQKSGTCHYGDSTFDVVDLPGTYSLSANSPEERPSSSRRTLPHSGPGWPKANRPAW